MERDLSFLNQPLETKKQAENFIRALQVHGLSFHFDDDVHDIIWGVEPPTYSELCAMDQRRKELYNFDWGSLECPIGFALKLLGVED